VNELKCPYCRAENRESAKFCVQCAQPITTTVKCPECNHINPQGSRYCEECASPLADQNIQSGPNQSIQEAPSSFVNDRYQVIRKLGEGGKKKVYLVHDTRLDRDVAFALIKTENLDEDGRKRITREAQAIGKLGDNPNIVSIFEMGELDGQPYIVQPYMPSDIEKLIEKAPDHKLPLDQVINLAKDVCRGLEFAHSKGIIHRDIKPGNVLVSDEGKARITDFGLVMVTNVSRLTQEGLMVGTPNYMSPEQAYSGEVTTKSDLYSLGAMIYEMVTGRPPFLGDDYVAVVTQHINASPVSPTWHRADLPTTFESLIMLLLEKDPEKRPNSARDVLQTLESIEKGDIQETTVDQQIPTESPIYRRIFIGRENELKQLQNAFNGSMSGQGALTMVVGEPGIGKTALCEQLSTYVTLRGGKTLWGHCYQEGSLSFPYLAFIEAMRSYVLDREPDDLKKELGSGATDVARIVSEIREKLHVEPRQSQNPEEDRYRLMQAVTSFLTNAASVKPMLVILEDLHDADKGTLELLSYVSRNLSNSRLLLVGTYRDVEVDRNHPLSAALAELRRASLFGRVLLRGLNIDEVRRMLESLTRDNIPIGLAEAVHRQTEGNPLFVQEVIRYLTEEGYIMQREGGLRSAKSTSLEMSIPEGLRDVIGKRLSLISSDCNSLLSIASVIGREFRLELLKKVSGLTEKELFNTIEEALKSAIVEEHTEIGAVVNYRFAHTFFRQTLYEEIIAPKRSILHQKVAEVLEEVYADHLELHAAELAEHFSHSPDFKDLSKSVSYGEMAAKRAMAVYAFSEAVRSLEQAFKIQEIIEPEDKVKQCDLLLELSGVLIYAGEASRVPQIEAQQAFMLAEAINDSVRASRACLLALESLGFRGAIHAYASPEYAKWAERIGNHAKSDTVERVRADMYLGCAKYATGNLTEARNLLNQGLKAARHLADPEEFWYAAGGNLLYIQSPQHINERLRLAEELIKMPRSGISTRTLASSLPSLAHAFLESGRRKNTEEIIKEVRDLANRTGMANLFMVSMALDIIQALLDGRLEEAVEISHRINTMSEELNLSEFASSLVGFTSLRPLILLGKFDEVLQNTGSNDLITIPARPLSLALSGRNTEAIEMLGPLIYLSRPDINSIDDETPGWVDILLLETSVLVEQRQVAELMLRKFTSNPIPTTGMFYSTCAPRHLGAAAVLLDKPEEALKHYREALKICEEMEFRPELALTRLQLAELLLDHYPEKKIEALKHLDFAVKEFREMRMQPSLEKALRRKDILKA